MREQYSFLKSGAIGLQERGGGDATYGLKGLLLRAGKGEGHQSRVGLRHGNAELLGQAEGEVGGPHLRDWLAAASHHKITRCDRS